MGVPIFGQDTDYLVKTAPLYALPGGPEPEHSAWWTYGGQYGAAAGRAVATGVGQLTDIVVTETLNAPLGFLGETVFHGEEPTEGQWRSGKPHPVAVQPIKNVLPMDEIRSWSNLDPNDYNELARIANGVTRGLTIGTLGTLAGSLYGNPTLGAVAALGATEGRETYQTNVGAVGHETAMKMAWLQGGMSGLGAAIPLNATQGGANYLFRLAMKADEVGNVALSKGLAHAAMATEAAAKTTLRRVSTGAFSNVATGAWGRYEMGSLLENAGHKEMALQYRVMDGSAIAADAILGMAFSSLSKFHDVKPVGDEVRLAFSHEKQALKARGEIGIPASVEAARVHADVYDRALAATIQDKPFTVMPEEAHTLVFESITDPDRLAHFRELQEANARVFGDIVDFTPVKRIGWDDLRSRVPEHLSERFEQDAALARELPKSIEAQMERLETETQIVLERAAKQLPKESPVDSASLATVLRNFPELRLEVENLEGQRAALEARLAEIRASTEAVLDRWRPFHDGAAKEFAGTRSEFQAQFAMEPGERFPAKPEAKLEAEPPVKAEKPAKAEADLMPPISRSQVEQLAARQPNAEVVLPDGRSVPASEASAALSEHLASEAQASKLVDVAVACFLGL